MTYYYNGTSGNDYFNYTGSDQLDAKGYGGNDFIWGNNGNDIISGGDGYDTLKGYYGDDILYGDNQDDALYGEAGNDQLYGGTGNDKMYGGTGNDYLDGWEGNDTLFGGDDSVGTNSGDDVLVAWKGNDLIYGGDGNDWLDGSYDNDKLYGGSGNDTLGNPVSAEGIGGEPGDDIMYGEGGSDQLYGGPGNDTLNGYSKGSYNYDTLTGGNGADIFVLGDSSDVYYDEFLPTTLSDDGYAIITDFKYWEGDKVQLKGPASLYTESDVNFGIGTSSLDTAIYNNGTLIAVLQDVSGSGFILNLDSVFV